MGYYTTYYINFQVEKQYEKEKDDFKKELLSISNNDVDVIDLFRYGSLYSQLYELEDWISTIAPHYPHLLVLLDGEGEESFDMWQSRWKGDKFETHQAVIPQFSESLMTTNEIKNKNLKKIKNKNQGHD